ASAGRPTRPRAAMLAEYLRTVLREVVMAFLPGICRRLAGRLALHRRRSECLASAPGRQVGHPHPPSADALGPSLSHFVGEGLVPSCPSPACGRGCLAPIEKLPTAAFKVKVRGG